ncbi:MAG: MFS transporter [Clostridia bacterium]|nr:MFS transporter [Clostridia bacterium]
MKNKIVSLFNMVKNNWKTPAKGRYMPIREIAAYSGGGIGAYMLITLGSACILGTGNTLISSTLGVDATDMYILYVIAVLVNIPLTGIRANIIDNTRNKAGKYRPYIVSMGIPTAIICILMVWFPYDKLAYVVGDGMIGGKTYAYIAKCALILIFNLLLHFFYYFFYDGYENLIHVLSPDTQERADVASVKSIVYSFAPTVVNFITPIIAGTIFKTNTTDIRVYRLLYPILGVFGILLCIVVYKYTEEKIVQARSHVIRIRFSDALRAVAKNKYFWIISLAGWIGFLESAYANILYWLYNYGGAASGGTYSLIYLIYGNASLWGMLLAPFCIKKWGKKMVLVVTNLMNVVFILMMLPVTSKIDGATIWLVMGCLYLNAFMGSFAHILNPAIQADIRDYQQYKTGERIDGMFAAVGTIGTIITLATSSVIPFIYEKGGITRENALKVTSDPSILDRLLGDGKTVGTILQEQFAQGQDSYSNPYSALYDPEVLINLLHVIIIVSAIGAFMNVVPYFWYDFNERKQKSVIRVLKIRAMFEDFGNKTLKDDVLVEGVDIIRNAREMAFATPRILDKNSYKSVHDKAARKEAKKLYREDCQYNEEIEIAKFVCEELDKFSDATWQSYMLKCREIYTAGLDGLKNLDINTVNAEISEARMMPKSTAQEKEIREMCIDMAKNKKRAIKVIAKVYSNGEDFVKPDYAVIDSYFSQEDECNAELKALYLEMSDAKKAKDYVLVSECKSKITELENRKKELKKLQKAEEDRIFNYADAAKPYVDAETKLTQMENYTHLDQIMAMYDEAKVRVDAE